MSDNQNPLAEKTIAREDGQIATTKVFVEELDYECEVESALDKKDRRRMNDIFEGLEEAGVTPSKDMAALFADKIHDPHPSDIDSIEFDEYSEDYVEQGMTDDLEIGLFFAVLLGAGKDEAVERMRNPEDFVGEEGNPRV